MVTAMSKPEELHVRLGRLRDEARGAGTATAGREQLDVVDAAVRVSAGLAGKSDVERRAALREVQPGSTVTAKGNVEKTRLSRTEKEARTLAWAETLTPDQREKFIVSEEFDALTDRQAEGISAAFDRLAERELEDSLGVENIDLENVPDVDAIVGNEDEDSEPIDAAELDESDYEELFNQAGWDNGEQS
jgi:hypothetical protein